MPDLQKITSLSKNAKISSAICQLNISNITIKHSNDLKFVT